MKNSVKYPSSVDIVEVASSILASPTKAYSFPEKESDKPFSLPGTIKSTCDGMEDRERIQRIRTAIRMLMQSLMHSSIYHDAPVCPMSLRNIHAVRKIEGNYSQLIISWIILAFSIRIFHCYVAIYGNDIVLLRNLVRGVSNKTESRRSSNRMNKKKTGIICFIDCLSNWTVA